jgi:hypothetical protein
VVVKVVLRVGTLVLETAFLQKVSVLEIRQKHPTDTLLNVEENNYG